MRLSSRKVFHVTSLFFFFFFKEKVAVISHVSRSPVWSMVRLSQKHKHLNWTNVVHNMIQQIKCIQGEFLISENMKRVLSYGIIPLQTVNSILDVGFVRVVPSPLLKSTDYLLLTVPKHTDLAVLASQTQRPERSSRTMVLKLIREFEHVPQT